MLSNNFDHTSKLTRPFFNSCNAAKVGPKSTFALYSVCLYSDCALCSLWTHSMFVPLSFRLHFGSTLTVNLAPMRADSTCNCTHLTFHCYRIQMGRISTYVKEKHRYFLNKTTAYKVVFGILNTLLHQTKGKSLNVVWPWWCKHWRPERCHLVWIQTSCNRIFPPDYQNKILSNFLKIHWKLQFSFGIIEKLYMSSLDNKMC